MDYEEKKVLTSEIERNVKTINSQWDSLQSTKQIYSS